MENTTQLNKLIMGEGKYLVTSTINTLIIKQLQSQLPLGEEIDLKYNNIINLFVI